MNSQQEPNRNNGEIARTDRQNVTNAYIELYRFNHHHDARKLLIFSHMCTVYAFAMRRANETPTKQMKNKITRKYCHVSVNFIYYDFRFLSNFVVFFCSGFVRIIIIGNEQRGCVCVFCVVDRQQTKWTKFPKNYLLNHENIRFPKGFWLLGLDVLCECTSHIDDDGLPAVHSNPSWPIGMMFT